jgi:hypothetical protein
MVGGAIGVAVSAAEGCSDGLWVTGTEGDGAVPPLAHAIAQLVASFALAHPIRHCPHGGLLPISPSTTDVLSAAAPTFVTSTIVHAAVDDGAAVSFGGLVPGLNQSAWPTSRAAWYPHALDVPRAATTLSSVPKVKVRPAIDPAVNLSTLVPSAWVKVAPGSTLDWSGGPTPTSLLLLIACSLTSAVSLTTFPTTTFAPIIAVPRPKLIQTVPGADTVIDTLAWAGYAVHEMFMPARVFLSTTAAAAVGAGLLGVSGGAAAGEPVGATVGARLGARVLG